MPQINSIIASQAFELLRDRIFEILVDEIENQFQLTGDYDLDIDVYKESSGPFDISQLPVVNVQFASGDWENRNVNSDDGTYQFNIDVHTAAKNTSAGAGDTSAAIKLQQILGVCRAILRNPKYKTLGFAVAPSGTPFILRTFCANVNIAATGAQDANNTAMGRIVFTVQANEVVAFVEPDLLDGYETTVKIDETGKGYIWIGENY